MFSAHCLRHMHEKGFKTFDPNDPRNDIDMCALAAEQGSARKAAKEEAVKGEVSNFVRIAKDEYDNEEILVTPSVAVSVASASDDPIVIEAPKFEPDSYAEDGTPIVYVN